MRRGNKFWIGLAAAGLTFGSLWAFVGPKERHCQGHWGYRSHGCGHESYQGCPHGHGGWEHQTPEAPKQDKSAL